MRVGTISYATQSGLGILAKAFFDHGIVNTILRVEHPHYTNHPEWYPANQQFNKGQIDAFLASIDVLLILENAFYWKVVDRARERGIRIVMIPMYEYSPYPAPVLIDYYICPSLLDLQYYEHLPSQFLPIPVDVPWSLRQKAHRFIHNAGHGGKGYRNGTPELLEAMRYVETPVHLTVRGQPGERRIKELFDYWKIRVDPANVTLVYDNVPQQCLYDGDVFIFPEKFNGLSLPLQEAYASGMLVMATNRFPMNSWLPAEPLINPSSYESDKIAVEFDKARLDPHTIAEQIDWWYDRDIARYSLSGKTWAEQHSWEALKPQYLKLLEGAV